VDTSEIRSNNNPVPIYVNFWRACGRVNEKFKAACVDDTIYGCVARQSKLHRIEEPTKGRLVMETIEKTLEERGNRYGNADHLGYQEQKIKETMRNSPNWKNDRLSDAQKYCLDMITTKMARILCGDPNYDDNWHDIQGYAKLIEDKINKEMK